MLSVVIPALNEAGAIGQTLEALLRLGGEALEIIVVDGQSTDETVAIARELGARVLSAPAGRGQQLKLGAEVATGEILWFLHADCIPPPDACRQIQEALQIPGVVGGNFDLLFDGDSSGARNLTRIYPQLRKIGLYYGDSGIFVLRDVYRAIGGVRPYPIFEDLDLIKRIRRQGRFVHLHSRITASSRRFDNRNFSLMFAEWTAMQILYWGGVHPEVLARWYAPIRAKHSKSS